jgi:error-prone DNA polymerase
LKRPPALLRDAAVDEELLELPTAPEVRRNRMRLCVAGTDAAGLSGGAAAGAVAKWRLMSAAELHQLPAGRLARACGIVTRLQQPSTAHGTIFVTLEDETGVVQVIVWKSLREKQREPLLRRGYWPCQEPGSAKARCAT